MNGFLITGIIVGLILIGILVVVVLRKQKEGKSRSINYKTFFILGIAFLPLGITYEIVFFASGKTVFLILGLSFIAMGLPYLVIGLTNRDKWEKM